MVADTKFYWNRVTNELIGDAGLHLSYGFLATNAQFVDKKALGWSQDYPSIYFLYDETLLVGWDPIDNVPISVIDAESKKYLWMHPKALKHAKQRAKEADEKRWTAQDFQSELNPDFKRKQRLKRKLKKLKRRR